MILTQEHHSILFSLAKRKGSSYIPWIWYIKLFNKNDFGCRYDCLICNSCIGKYATAIPTLDVNEQIDAHGLSHLKEYNMLHLI